MRSILQDLRFSLKTLAMGPGFTGVAILTLALGIGANSAILSFVDSFLIRRLPFQDPARLTMVWLDNERSGVETDVTSYPNFRDWRQSDAFTDMGAFALLGATLSGEGAPERVDAAMVTANLFPVLGVAPERGEAFSTGKSWQERTRW